MSLQKFRAKLKLRTRFQETLNRIDTEGDAPPVAPGAWGYEPTPYSILDQTLSPVRLTEQDSFVDVGCGKGRVVCVVAQRKLRHVTGIELSEDLAAIARKNVNKTSRLKSSVDIVHQSATEFDYSSTTVIYMYNPFTDAIMPEFLDRVRKAGNRDLRLIYVNPKFQFCFEAVGWLKKYHELPAGSLAGVAYGATYWRPD